MLALVQLIDIGIIIICESTKILFGGESVFGIQVSILHFVEKNKNKHPRCNMVAILEEIMNSGAYN